VIKQYINSRYCDFAEILIDWVWFYAAEKNGRLYDLSSLVHFVVHMLLMGTWYCVVYGLLYNTFTVIADLARPHLCTFGRRGP